MSNRSPLTISFTGIANFLGVIGIIGSLLFVGLELRQSHRIALADQIQSRNAMISNFIIAPLNGSATALRMWGEQGNDLTEEERLVRSQITRHRILTLTNAWQQYELGLLSLEAWQQAESRARGIWDNCSTRYMTLSTFTSSLISYAESNWSDNIC
jgi:hypothetical protein